MKRVTPRLADIAKQAGVSVPTVAKVVNGSGSGVRVSQATRDRVLAIAEQLGYTRNRAAAQLSSGKTDMIGIVVDRFDSPFYARLVNSLLPLLESHGLGLVPIVCDGKNSMGSLAGRAIMERVADGVFLLEQSSPQRSSTFPIVSREWARDESYSTHCVAVNYRASFDALLEVLRKRKPAKMALLVQMSSGRKDFLKRGNSKLELYRYGVDALGLERSDQLVAGAEGPSFKDKLESTYQNTLDLLKTHSDIDTLLVDTGELAAPVYRAATACGRTIGSDLAVAAWTGTNDSDWFTPSLTVMDEPTDAVAEALVRIMMSLLSDDEPEIGRIEVQSILTVRESLC